MIRRVYMESDKACSIDLNVIIAVIRETMLVFIFELYPNYFINFMRSYKCIGVYTIVVTKQNKLSCHACNERCHDSYFSCRVAELTLAMGIIPGYSA